VAMYEDIDYKGASKKICGEIPNFVPIGWNDKASSMKIPKGIKVDLFWDINYTGKKLSLDKDTPNFVTLGWNDQASSAKITKNDKVAPKAAKKSCATMYQDINYKGPSKEICGEVLNFVTIGWNDKASSIKIPNGVKVDLFWDINYGGKKITLDKDTANFVTIGWNDKASSAKVYKGVSAGAGKGGHHRGGVSKAPSKPNVARGKISRPAVRPPSPNVAKPPTRNCATMYEHINYGGASKEICGNIINFVSIGWNDKASSIRIPAGVKVDLFWDINYRGKKITLTKDTANFVTIGWNDQASSAKVYH